MRVLFVEDDVLLGQALAAGLRQLGHAADWFTNGGDADGALMTTSYDALVLDPNECRRTQAPIRRRSPEMAANAAALCALPCAPLTRPLLPNRL